MKLADAIEAPSQLILKEGDYPRLSGMPSVITTVLKSWTGGHKSSGLERDYSRRKAQREMSQVNNYLEPGKSKETESPIEPSEGSTDSLVIHWF